MVSVRIIIDRACGFVRTTNLKISAWRRGVLSFPHTLRLLPMFLPRTSNSWPGLEMVRAFFVRAQKYNFPTNYHIGYSSRVSQAAVRNAGRDDGNAGAETRWHGRRDRVLASASQKGLLHQALNSAQKAGCGGQPPRSSWTALGSLATFTPKESSPAKIKAAPSLRLMEQESLNQPTPSAGSSTSASASAVPFFPACETARDVCRK